MRHVKTIQVESGHNMAIFKLPKDELDGCNFFYNLGPHNEILDLPYTDFYVVKNFDIDGVTFFYIAKGYKDAPKEYHVWYRNKKMWSSYGTNFKDAIEGAQKDGWLHAD